MVQIKVHGHPGSPATAAVLCCLKEKNVQYEFDGHQKNPENIHLNALGEILSIQDGDHHLLGPTAIIRYLATKYKGQGADLLGSTERKQSLVEQSLVEQWCELEGAEFISGAVSIIKQVLLAPMTGGSTSKTEVEISVEKLGKVLDTYERRLSKNKYLAGDFFSMADLQLLPYVHYLMNGCRKGDLISSRKYVKAWWERISPRPAWKEVAENMQASFKKVADHFQERRKKDAKKLELTFK